MAQLPAGPRDTHTCTHSRSPAGKWAPFTGHPFHTPAQAPQSHTRHTHTQSKQTHTHCKHTHTQAPQSHTQDTHTPCTRAWERRAVPGNQATSPGSRAGQEEREAGESAPGRKRGENGSACQSVLPQVADRQKLRRLGRWGGGGHGIRSALEGGATPPNSLSRVGQRGGWGQAGAKGLQTKGGRRRPRQRGPGGPAAPWALGEALGGGGRGGEQASRPLSEPHSPSPSPGEAVLTPRTKDPTA